MNHYGRNEFIAFSAGSEPTDSVNPYALKVIAKSGLETEHLVPKDMLQFVDEQIDFVITLCDKMKEDCPLFPSKPIYAHWGMPDPAEYEGSDEEKNAYFRKIFQEISNRINLFMNIKHEKLDKLAIQKELEDIANSWEFVR